MRTRYLELVVNVMENSDKANEVRINQNEVKRLADHNTTTDPWKLRLILHLNLQRKF
jgi:hypothetical protein